MRKIPLRLERDFGEKINVTFQFATQNWRPLLNCLLYLVLPVSMLSGIASALLQTDIQQVTAEMGTGDIDSSSPMAILDLYRRMGSAIFGSNYTYLTWALGFLSEILLGMTVVGYMKAYLEANIADPLASYSSSAEISLQTVVNSIKESIIAVAVNKVVVFFLVILGTIFFIIPGIYIAIPFYALTTFVIMIEGKGVTDSLSRSLYLIRDKWWSTFGLMFIMAIIIGIMGMIFSIPTAIVQLTAVGKSEASLPYIAVTAIATGLSKLLESVIVIAMGFQYFNLVERRDGTGLLGQINNIGTPPPPATEKEEEGEY
jgi:hypothetical protein